MNIISKSDEQETFLVPSDVMLEIAQIILKADLAHEIIGTKENKRQILISVRYQAYLKFHQDALKNINDILSAYQDLCNEESETVNWRY
jgi:hypothetical protein